MNYKLAKELKDAGFPFKKLRLGDRFISPKGLFFSEEERRTLHPLELALRVPLLDELIEACEPEKYFFRLGFGGVWRATLEVGFERETGFEYVKSDGKTPDIAVAKLWLALNKK